jgi:hypothetical protein
MKKCNVCGKSFKDTGLYTEFHNPMLHKFVVTFDYGSCFDMERWEFWKCEDCLLKEIKTFSVLPKMENYEIFI